MVEKIARAICEVNGHLPDDVNASLQPKHKSLEYWRGYISHASATIEVMRPILEGARDHIIGSTGALPGSDSAEQVNIINSILDNTPMPPGTEPE